MKNQEGRSGKIHQISRKSTKGVKSVMPASDFTEFINSVSKNPNLNLKMSIDIEPVKQEMSTKEASEFLGVTPRSVHNLMDRGIIKMQKRGGKNIYFRDNLQEAKDNGFSAVNQ